MPVKVNDIRLQSSRPYVTINTFPATNIAPSPSNNDKSSQPPYQPSAQLSQPAAPHVKNDFGENPRSTQNEKNLELQRMVQQLYMAQAQVRLNIEIET